MHCQQTINELVTEVNDALPQGHEAAERSRHLLNKAENILQSDPTRSAEIDYYLQQVRRIVQRARQTQEWSDLYRKRLSLYSVAWLLLAGVVMAACLLLQVEFRYELQMLFLLDVGSPIVLFTPLVVATMAAGAFGATVSALLGMRRHVHKEYGYFDRKYGLRGLLLPIAGLFLRLSLWRGRRLNLLH